MNIFLAGAVWVIGIAGVAAAITILVHRYTADERGGGDATATVFGVVGGLHAVLLAFVLISLFDAVSTAQDGSHEEANALVAVYWAAGSLPDPARDQVQDLARSYARTVVDQEWPGMREGAPDGGPGYAVLDRMRAAIDGAQVDGDWQQDRKSEAADQLTTVYEARQARLSAASDAGISTVVWIALIIGSVLSLSLPYLFDVSKLGTHMVIVASLAGTIALLMFAIYQLQNPFSGGARVEPDAFISVIEKFTANQAG